MKRRFEIVTAILVVIIVIGALVIASKKGTLDNKKSIFSIENSGNKVTSNELEVSDKVANFDLDIQNTALEVVKGTGDKIVIECKSNGNSEYVINQDKNDIHIVRHNTNRGFIIFNWNDDGGKVTIKVPEEIEASFTGDMSNGGVSIDDIKSDKININTSNGFIRINNVTVNKDIKIETSNGGINVKNLIAENVSFDSSNGGATISNVKGNKIIIDTSNGEINAYECYGDKVELDTSNGNIALENLEDKEFVIDELRISTSNGSENINANYNHKR